MRRILLVCLAAAVTLPVGLDAGARPASSRRPRYECRDTRDRARPFRVQVAGETATGLYSVPGRPHPKGLVVFAHGYGHTSASWAHHAIEASRHGLIAVVMDYRGLEIFPDDDDPDTLPSSRGWPAMAGAEDSLAAAEVLSTFCRIDSVSILSVSMGGNMAGLAVALAGERGVTKHVDGSPLFDYWIDVEGVVNVIETYMEARTVAPFNAFAKQAQADIEAEMGGPIEQRFPEYQERAVVTRIDDIRAAGLDGAVVIHGVDDGLVPYNQGREMATLLGQSRIPTDMITVGVRDADSERETTLTGTAAGQLKPDYVSPLAGHASEKSTTHIVMNVAFDRLWAIVAGETPQGYRECTANGDGPQRFACAPAAG
jgi:hypothetical protein